MKLIEKAIYELIKTLAGGNVFAMRAPDKAEGPFIIFQRIDSTRWDSINGTGGMIQAQIQIDAYAKGYYEAKTISAQIEGILNKYSGSVTHDSIVYKIAGVRVQNDVDIFDDTDQPYLFRNSAVYSVTFET
jgi:hypothetical protein